MIALRTVKAALASLNSCNLLDFAVKLLNLPSLTTRFLSISRRILSYIVGGEIFRAVGCDHYSKQFQPCVSSKFLDLDRFAVSWFIKPPRRIFNRRGGIFTAGVVKQAILL